MEKVSLKFRAPEVRDASNDPAIFNKKKSCFWRKTKNHGEHYSRTKVQRQLRHGVLEFSFKSFFVRLTHSTKVS